MSKRIIPIVLCICLIFSTCKNDKSTGIYDKGRIEYKITYLNKDGNFDPSFLPKKMILEFNSEFCTNTIDGFMGMFKLGNITYFKKKKSITHLKVLDKNYLFQGGRNELMCCFDTFEDMIIERDTITKIISGLKSQHAKAYIPGLEEKFDIYYTQDINLEHPNVTNPYLDIDGVLTEFVLFMGPYKMKFEAKKFDPSKSPKKDIELTDNPYMVSRDEMVYALDRLMR